MVGPSLHILLGADENPSKQFDMPMEQLNKAIVDLKQSLSLQMGNDKIVGFPAITLELTGSSGLTPTSSLLQILKKPHDSRTSPMRKLIAEMIKNTFDLPPPIALKTASETKTWPTKDQAKIDFEIQEKLQFWYDEAKKERRILVLGRYTLQISVFSHNLEQDRYLRSRQCLSR